MASDSIIDDIARDLVELVSEDGGSCTSSYIISRLATLERILSLVERTGNRDTAVINGMQELTDVVMSGSSEQSNIPSIIREVRKAEKSRLEKNEYETMARLLNKTEGQEGMLGVLGTLQAGLGVGLDQTAELSRATEVRRLALIMLTELIASMQESLLHEPSEDLLPSLESINPSLVILD